MLTTLERFLQKFMTLPKEIRQVIYELVVFS